MKATELRIGNYVMYEPTIDDWEENVITLHSLLQVDISPESYCGIPITEEWLLKFGFSVLFDRNEYSKGVKSYRKNNTGSQSQDVSHHNKGGFTYGVTGVPVTKVKYVHQLQNLYFALTGEELELT